MWDQRYAEEGYAYGTRPNDFLVAQASRIKAGGRVLCLAEGEGRNAVHLATLGFEVVAVDTSPVGLEKARSLADSQGVSISTVHADLADYDLGVDAWDAIISVFAHVRPPLRRELHAAIFRALRPEGVFLLEAYTPRQPEMPGNGGPPASRPDMFMTANGLTEELVGLKLHVCQEVERDIHEGRYHNGMSAVVQVVGRRG
mgnify:CR=1 FL=1